MMYEATELASSCPGSSITIRKRAIAVKRSSGKRKGGIDDHCLEGRETLEHPSGQFDRRAGVVPDIAKFRAKPVHLAFVPDVRQHQRRRVRRYVNPLRQQPLIGCLPEQMTHIVAGPRQSCRRSAGSAAEHHHEALPIDHSLPHPADDSMDRHGHGGGSHRFEVVLAEILEIHR
jgi:hypothetical protein